MEVRKSNGNSFSPRTPRYPVPDWKGPLAA